MKSSFGICAVAFALAISGCSGSEQSAQSAGAQEPASTQAKRTSSDWSVDPELSRISFVSVKAGEVGESHFFRTVTGNVSPEGEVRLEIPLEAVETRVEIRNERMKSMFFDTQTYPKAILTATIPVDEYENLSVGERQPASIDGQLSLHGMLVDLSSEIFVSRLSDDKVVVETSEPVILDVVSFGLGDGLAALQEIAGLPSISPAVPVSASIVFTQ